MLAIWSLFVIWCLLFGACFSESKMLIDTHAHLDMREFNDDREDVIKRAREAGVEYIITIGSTVESSRDAVLLADKYDFIYAAIGVHPHEAKDILHPAYDVLRHFAQHKKVVAYGEIGLDYYYEHSIRSVQQRKFRDMLREARELNLPVIIHDRDAHDDTYRIVSEEWSPDIGGVMHCFTGDWAMAEQAMALNFHISFSGIVTFKSAIGLQAVAREMPAERMLVETDTPYLTPVPHRGRPNRPALVPLVGAAIAEVLAVDADLVERTTTATACSFYGLDDL